jgi:hypothetical protein
METAASGRPKRQVSLLPSATEPLDHAIPWGHELAFPLRINWQSKVCENPDEGHRSVDDCSD